MNKVTNKDLCLQHEAEQLIYREAYLLDMRRFDDWLALFSEDAQYLMPAWVDETTLASDPAKELFLIYFHDKSGLDDRVYRIGTRDSYASTPMPRSAHVVGNVLLLAVSETTIDASCSWTVHQYGDRKGARIHGGRYDYTLRRDDNGVLKIAKKHITFLNDRVDIPIDVYNV
ncbi:MAG: aromatic-ring-hydroxylating dioxygenase subunit beta [Rhodospirillales bacterium]